MSTQYPLHLMAGAPWNILDDSGRRVAICHGNDLQGDATAADINLARRLVGTFNAARHLSETATNLKHGTVTSDDYEQAAQALFAALK